VLRLLERQAEPVDDQEADHAEQRRVAVAADDADHVPGKHARIAPAQRSAPCSPRGWPALAAEPPIEG
jgi:hypothetical protein